MIFLFELLIIVLNSVYGYFIAITYLIMTHYFKKWPPLRDILFWIAHIFVYGAYYDSICNYSFRIYDILSLIGGFLLGIRFSKVEAYLPLIDKILLLFQKLLVKINSELWISSSLRTIVHKIKFKHRK